MLSFLFNKVPEFLHLTKPKNGLHVTSNGLNGYHGKPSAVLTDSPKEDVPLEKQPTLQFAKPVAKVTDKPLPIIQERALQNLMRKIEKYLDRHPETATKAFATEINSLKDLPNYAEKPSLAKNDDAKVFQFIQTAFPKHTSTEPRDQLTIDVVTDYCENKRNHRKALFKICDMILSVTTIQKYASQMENANNAGKKEEYELLQTLYYDVALTLYKRLSTTKDTELKQSSDLLRREIEQAYPEKAALDFPARRATRACPA